MTRLLSVALATALIVALVAAGSAAQMPAQGSPPPGANDFTCKPTRKHPAPVILLHGTGGDMGANFINLAPLLKEKGYCTFALDFGNRGFGPIDDSANQIAAFTRRVLRATGAAKISFVGHSQMIGRYVARFKRLWRRVDDIVGIAPSSHGTDTPAAPLAGLFGCTACLEQIAGSDLVRRLNRGDETPGKISYTSIITRYDEIVTPYQTQKLRGPRWQVTNVVLQGRCPEDSSDHISIAIPGDPVALQWVMNALGRKGPAKRGFWPVC